ncbi:metallophosphoesterase [Chitinibacter bivalviorum]|uniref:Metallophosphoesterase n=1 Tax=Chitinibacter bivalviorum TaxID=2739434 RepID=A0A7H9BMB8_9NEIS|nr:metallophosphoesterase [Chitinibacter bivalviorum]QLG89546.1 metallophosphoesterase [Chitinibacter bivalviorum]
MSFSFMRHLLLASVLMSTLFAAQAADKDPVVATFATVGDSRAEPGLTQTKQDQIWLQHTKAWSRMMREIQQQKPHALFFNGDMIMGYTTDKNVLNRQYAYWRGMVTGLQETGTYIVPVPGNHEVQEKFKEDGKTKKIARQSNEDSWRDNMGDLIVDAERWKATVGSNLSAFDPKNTPTIGGADKITTDQSQLSYSFDFAGSHFVVINTDPVGNDNHAPIAWLEQDLAQAKARGAKRMFVFGHKPAFTYFFKPGIDLEGLDKFPEHQQAFWKIIEDNQATYFCGHEHIYNVMQPTKNAGGKAYQVMVGSGGSPFSVEPGETQNPEDRTYAWALVKVHASGKVEIDTYGFDEHYGNTKLLKHLVI